jgi:ABC-type xylose transport system permease subunit
MELDIIAAVVIGGASLAGGQGTILGSVVGALIMSVVANGCSIMGWSNGRQMIVTGVIIVLAVSLDQLRNRRTA